MRIFAVSLPDDRGKFLESHQLLEVLVRRIQTGTSAAADVGNDELRLLLVRLPFDDIDSRMLDGMENNMLLLGLWLLWLPLLLAAAVVALSIHY